ncbi:hypothetical protein FRX31_014325 [Thalictrum thalictroides]|uniref:Uncharacterized protein n=1 Tax=Thalictrum thalictroides TaxID=46969 RepID=A0A7J6WGQ0_THATH|nr:hypothetical protein FRX31_014325 [Thalictrum thalictroides]
MEKENLEKEKSVLMGTASTQDNQDGALEITVSGISLFAIGAHLSYVNIAPQQARAKARKEFVKERLLKKYWKE